MSDSASYTSESSTSNQSSESDGEIDLSGQIQPYQNEPLASEEEQDESDEEADVDGLTPNTLARRFEKEVEVREWCRCGKCSDEQLVSALEYRCCSEVNQAIGMMVFDGSVEKIKCITEHEDYSSLTNKTVLTQVAPLLRGRNGQVYRRTNGSSQNELLRAVAYRWIIRWLCGYMGWDNCRPLPACVYNHIRKKFRTHSACGYSTTQERE